MVGSWDSPKENCSYRYFTQGQIDQILREGAWQGRAGSHAAIERILKHEPALERADLWRRIRQLVHPPRKIPFRRAVWCLEDDRLLQQGYRGGWRGKRQAVRELLKRHPDWRPHVIWKRAAKLGLVQEHCGRGQERARQRWSAHDDQLLLNLAGYKHVRVIGKLLHRSPNAVRSRLKALGKSSRVHKEGYARRDLATELHLGTRTIQKLIVEGLLEVRDPRITRKSLEDWCRSGGLRTRSGDGGSRSAGRGPRPEEQAAGTPRDEASAPSPNGRSAVSRKASRAGRAWAEVAAAMNVKLEEIEKLISRGALKLYDPRITEKSLMNFCRMHGAMINYDFLNEETRNWLESSMNFVRDADEDGALRLERYRKQARAVRRCGTCGRNIRGNAFFRHIKECGRLENSTGQPGTHQAQERGAGQFARFST